MSTIYKLDHFLTAQELLYPQVLAELEQGRKQTHWMWFVFPQLLGLGTSSKAVRYGLRNLDHAKAYLAHPVLGLRLRECAAILTKHPNKSATEIFGPIDALKLHSSLTLFALASEPDSIFHLLLNQFFSGEMDSKTFTENPNTRH